MLDFSRSLFPLIAQELDGRPARSPYIISRNPTVPTTTATTSMPGLFHSADATLRSHLPTSPVASGHDPVVHWAVSSIFEATLLATSSSIVKPHGSPFGAGSATTGHSSPEDVEFSTIPIVPIRDGQDPTADKTSGISPSALVLKRITSW